MSIPFMDIGNVPFRETRIVNIIIGPDRDILLSDDSNYRTNKSMGSIISDLIMINDMDWKEYYII